VTERIDVPDLLLLVARYAWRQKNAVAATLAWASEQAGWLFEAYYDARRLGIHFGGGNPRKATLEALAGGPVSGGRHLEWMALATQRFRSTVVACGPVLASGLLAELEGSRNHTTVVWAQEGDLVGLYEAVFSALEQAWPTHAVMLASMTGTRLEGIDGYCYPEVFFQEAIGVEETLRDEQLLALFAKGVRDMFTVGVQPARRDQLRRLGFAVHDSELIKSGDDYASVSRHLVERWGERRSGWFVGDPVLASYWLPTACRQRRLAIFGIPQVRVVADLHAQLAESAERDAPTPVIGRQ